MAQLEVSLVASALIAGDKMNNLNMPIFVVWGAMGVGKSTIAGILIVIKSKKYIIVNWNSCNIVTFQE